MTKLGLQAPAGEGPPPPAPISIAVTGNTLKSLAFEWAPDAGARPSTLYAVELQQEGDNQWHKVLVTCLHAAACGWLMI